jgi:hypothetical protein
MVSRLICAQVPDNVGRSWLKKDVRHLHRTMEQDKASSRESLFNAKRYGPFYFHIYKRPVSYFVRYYLFPRYFQSSTSLFENYRLLLFKPSMEHYAIWDSESMRCAILLLTNEECQTFAETCLLCADETNLTTRTTLPHARPLPPILVAPHSHHGGRVVADPPVHQNMTTLPLFECPALANVKVVAKLKRSEKLSWKVTLGAIRSGSHPRVCFVWVVKRISSWIRGTSTILGCG